MTDHYTDARARNRVSTNSMLLRAGYSSGGMAIPTEEQRDSKTANKNTNSRGDALRAVKGKSPVNGTGDKAWNEIVESAAQALDKSPAKLDPSKPIPSGADLDE